VNKEIDMPAKQRIAPPSLSRGVFGWDACRLADAYSTQELTDAITWLGQASCCANPDRDSIWLLNKKARRISEQLAWAVRHQMEEKRRAEQYPLGYMQGRGAA